MNPHDFPSLYQSASDLSAKAQSSYFRTLKAHLLLLVVAAAISVINSDQPVFALIQALVLLAALGCAIYLYSAKPDRQWYAARALAESVKTATWRYVTRAEPFNHSDQQDSHNFVLKLRDVVTANRDIAARMTSTAGHEQITQEMGRVRSLGGGDRQNFYREHRIVDQLTWYTHKAASNRRHATLYYSLLFVTIAVAIIFSLAKIWFPKAPYWPTDAIVAIAGSFLSWIQVKRFQELAASYSLTAHEISFIREQASAPMDDSMLSNFVGDAENAFSREHTQWTARRDLS